MSVVAFKKSLITLIVELVLGLYVLMADGVNLWIVCCCEIFRNSATAGRARVGSRCLLLMCC